MSSGYSSENISSISGDALATSKPTLASGSARRNLHESHECSALCIGKYSFTCGQFIPLRRSILTGRAARRELKNLYSQVALLSSVEKLESAPSVQDEAVEIANKYSLLGEQSAPGTKPHFPYSWTRWVHNPQQPKRTPLIHNKIFKMTPNTCQSLPLSFQRRSAIGPASPETITSVRYLHVEENFTPFILNGTLYCNGEETKTVIIPPPMFPNSNFVDSISDAILKFLTSDDNWNGIIAGWLPEERTHFSVSIMTALVSSMGALKMIYGSTADMFIGCTMVLANTFNLWSLFRAIQARVDRLTTLCVRNDVLSMFKNPLDIIRLLDLLSDKQPNAFSDHIPSAAAARTVLPYAKLFSFFLILISGLSLAKGRPTDSMIDTFASQIRNAKTVADSSDTIVTPISDIFAQFHAEVALGPAVALKALADECTYLLTLTAVDFFLDRSKYEQLLTLPDRITTSLSQIKTDKPSAAVNSLAGVVSHQLQALQTRILELKLLDHQELRIDPTPCILSGGRRVGKTVLMRTLREKCGKALDRPTSSYQLNKPVGAKHALTYLDQYFAHFDEFLYEPAKDPLVADWNNVFSSAPYALPGASLSEKKQYLKVGMVFLTTNQADKTCINKASSIIDAMFSRAIWISVSDPIVERSEDPTFTEFHHRRDDFSHLTLTHRPHKGPNEFGVSQNLTIDELCKKLVDHAAREEIKFLRAIISKFPAAQDTEAMEKRIMFLRRRINAPDIHTMIPNSNSEPIVVRFQGPAYVGKTYRLSEWCKSLYNYAGLLPEYILSMDDLPNPGPKPKIFIFDDVLVDTTECMQKYLEFVNSTHPHSIIAIATNNHIPLRESKIRKVTDAILPGGIISTVNYPKFYYTVPDCYPPGCVRRVGLNGVVYHKGVKTILNDNYTTTVELANGMMYINNEPLTSYEALEAFMEKYRKCVRFQAHTFMPHLPDRNWDVTFTCKNIGQIADVMKDQLLIIQVVTGKHPDIKYQTTARAMDVGGKIDFSDFVIKTPTTEEERDDFFMYFANKLRRADPQFSMLLRTDTMSYASDTNGIYKTGGELIDYCVPSPADLGVGQQIHIGTADIFLTIEDVLKCCRTPVQSDFAPSLVSRIRESVLPSGQPRADWASHLAGHILSQQIEETSNTLKKQYIRDIVITGFTTLVSAVTIGALVWGGWKLMNRPKPEERIRYDKNLHISRLKANAYRRQREVGQSKRMSEEEYREYEKALRAIEEDDIHIRQRKDLSPMERRALNDYDMEQDASNQHYPNCLASDAEIFITYWDARDSPDKMKAFFTLYGDTPIGKFIAKSEPKPNMVRTLPPLDNKTKLVQDAVRVCEEALVRIECDGAACHGLKIRDKQVITVAHIIPKGPHGPIIVSFDRPPTKSEKALGITKTETMTYEAHVAFLNREQDKCLLDVSIGTQFKDISNWFAPRSDLMVATTGYFLQTGETPFAYEGSITIHEQPVMGWDMPEQNFYLNQEFVSWEIIGMQLATDFVNGGDCGAPLLILTDNGPRIAGFHNSYSLKRLGFSIFTKESFTNFKMISKPNSTVVQFQPIRAHGKNFLAMPEVASLTKGLRPDGRQAENVLSRGSRKDLADYMNPKYKKKLYRSPDLEITHKQAFAPVTIKDVKDPSKLYFNKLRGRHDIMWTQIAKFGERNGRSPDMEIWQKTYDTVLWNYKKNYGQFRIISFSEVINGVQNRNDPLYQYVNSLDLRTSPGIVLNKLYGCHAKLDVMTNIGGDQHQHYVINDTPGGQYVKRAINNIWAVLPEMPVVYAAKAALKKEVLAAEKANEGGTRVFQAMDLDAILVRGRMTRSTGGMFACRRSVGCAQRGINPYREFTIIKKRFSHLRELGKTDNKRFDKSQQLRENLAYARTRWEMLPEAERNETNLRRYLNDQLGTCHAIQVGEGSVFQAGNGNLSGQADTEEINDYVDEFLITYAVIKFLRDHLKWNLEDTHPSTIRKQFDAVCLGDDLWPAVARGIMDDFTEEFLIDAAQDLNITVTAGNKGTSEDQTWLSRLTDNVIDGIVYPGLKKTSIEREMQYFERFEINLVASNLQSAMLEAALWDRPYYEQICRCVEQQCAYFNKLVPDFGTKVMANLEIRPYPYIFRMWTKYIRGTDDELISAHYENFSSSLDGNLTREHISDLPVLKTQIPNQIKRSKQTQDALQQLSDDLEELQLIGTPSYKYLLDITQHTHNNLRTVAIQTVIDQHRSKMNPNTRFTTSCKVKKNINHFTMTDKETGFIAHGEARSLTAARTLAEQMMAEYLRPVTDPRLLVAELPNQPEAGLYELTLMNPAWECRFFQEFDEPNVVWTTTYTLGPHVGTGKDKTKTQSRLNAARDLFQKAVKNYIPTEQNPASFDEQYFGRFLHNAPSTSTLLSQFGRMTMKPNCAGKDWQDYANAKRQAQLAAYMDADHEEQWLLPEVWNWSVPFTKQEIDRMVAAALNDDWEEYDLFHQFGFSYYDEEGDYNEMLDDWESFSMTPNMLSAASAMPKPTASAAPSMPVSNTPVMGGTAGGISTGVPPVHDDQPASTTMAGAVNMPSDFQIRASRDQPAQIPLMTMSGGVPNLSIMNMHQDDIINYLYRQFDAGTVTSPGGAAKATILWKQTYGLNLLHAQAQRLVRMHKRFNGKIRITVSTSAVPMSKGDVIIGIMRETPPDSVTSIDIADLQKINWCILKIQGSGEYTFELGDARQEKFWRNVADDPPGVPPVDAATRPCLICAVYTPIVNQFADSDSSVTFNFRSAAVSPLEDPEYGFYCYEPTDLTSYEPFKSAMWSQNLRDYILAEDLMIDSNEQLATPHNTHDDLKPREWWFNNGAPVTGTRWVGTSYRDVNSQHQIYQAHIFRPAYDIINTPETTEDYVYLLAKGPCKDEALSFIGDQVPKETKAFWINDAGEGKPLTAITQYFYYKDGWARLVTYKASGPDSTSPFRGFSAELVKDPKDYPQVTDVNVSSNFEVALPTNYWNITATKNPGLISAVDRRNRYFTTKNELYDILRPLARSFNWSETSNSHFSVDLVDVRTDLQLGTLTIPFFSPGQVIIGVQLPTGIFHAIANATVSQLKIQNPRVTTALPSIITTQNQFIPMYEAAPPVTMEDLRAEFSRLMGMRPNANQAVGGGWDLGTGLIQGGMNAWFANGFQNKNNAWQREMFNLQSKQMNSMMWMQIQNQRNQQIRQNQFDYLKQANLQKQDRLYQSAQQQADLNAKARLAGVEGTNLDVRGALSNTGPRMASVQLPSNIENIPTEQLENSIYEKVANPGHPKQYPPQMDPDDPAASGGHKPDDPKGKRTYSEVTRTNSQIRKDQPWSLQMEEAGTSIV